MPVNSPLQTSLVRDANVAMALAFFPRWRKGFWQELAGSTLSTSLVEPFALAGAAPLMKRYQGNLSSRGIASWALQSPNLLFKNFEELKRTDVEMDQTGTILRRVDQIGIRVAQAPDYLMAKRILAGDSVSNASIVFEDGNTYYLTFENGIPFFSTAHTTYAKNVQSNILQGSLPAGSLSGLNVASLANAMQSDIGQLVDMIAGIVDDKGAQIYPDFDPELHLVVCVPPVLKPAARLAFSVLGAQIGGSNGTGGTSGATTSIGPMMVKRVISSPLLKGCIDIENQDDYAMVSPAQPNQYYVYIENDLVRPYYFQRFRPKANGEYSPLGANPEAAAAAAIKAAEKQFDTKFSQEAKDVYSQSTVDHNLSALGAQSQESVAVKEKFFMSGRSRFNLNYGPWFTGFKIDPTGIST